jgi:hypothetical protein
MIFKSVRLVKEVAHAGSDRIRSVIQEFTATHEFPLPKPIGRPKVLTAEVMAMISTQTALCPAASCAQLRRFLESKDIHITSESVRTARHALKFSYKPPKQRQLLTALHIARRLSFAYSMLNAGTFSENIIFSDESRFAQCNDSKWIWRRRGDVNDEVFADKVKYPSTTMVFGAIGKGFRSKLCFPDGSVTSWSYLRMLEEEEIISSMDARYGKGGYVFQQDGAPAHTSRDTLLRLRFQVRLLATWPANSPDLNVIEHVWGMMKRVLSSLAIGSEAELKAALTTIWMEIPQDVLDSLVDSFRYRLHLLILHGGASLNPFLRHGRHEECFVLPNPVNIELSEGLVIGLDVPSDLPILPEIRMGPFDAEENRLLWQLYTQHGPKWKKLQYSFPNRTVAQLRCRIRALTRRGPGRIEQ